MGGNIPIMSLTKIVCYKNVSILQRFPFLRWLLLYMALLLSFLFCAAFFALSASNPFLVSSVNLSNLFHLSALSSCRFQLCSISCASLRFPVSSLSVECFRASMMPCISEPMSFSSTIEFDWLSLSSWYDSNLPSASDWDILFLILILSQWSRKVQLPEVAGENAKV